MTESARKAKPFKLKSPHVLEHVEQEALFLWAAAMERKEPRLALLNASLNGVRLRPHQASMAKKGGMKRGYPDLFLPAANGLFHGLFIELKRKDGKPSDASKEQRQWLAALSEQGYLTALCFGWEEAAALIGRYLGMQE